MRAENRIWQGLNLIAILLTAILPAYLSLYTTKQVTEKRLESDRPFASDFTSSLMALGDRLSLSMFIDHKEIKNIISSTMTVTNTGSVPILPSEYYEKLSINVNDPWSVLSVVANDPPVGSIWHRVSDQKFEAEPSLLNPGDTIRVTVYLTNTKMDHPTFQEINDINLSWSTHIVNLKGITNKVGIIDSEADEMWGAVINLYGWGLFTTIFLSVIFMSEYVHLLYKKIILRETKWKVITCLVGVGFLSVAASESIATYLFPSLWVKLTGIPHRMNLPWIVANFTMLIYLWWKAYTTHTTRGHSAQPPQDR